MATYYVKSTATGTADGLSWANAFLTLGAADAVDVAGDTIYVSQSHAETTASAITHSWAGTPANPTRIICANDTAEPPVSVANTATVTSTGAGVTVGGSVYSDGVSYIANGALILSNAVSTWQLLKNCTLHVTLNSSNTNVVFNNIASISTAVNICDNVVLRQTHAASGFSAVGGKVIFKNCSIHPSSVAIDRIFSSWGGGRGQADILMDSCDFALAASSVKMVGAASGNGANTLVMRNCKLPASWTGTLFNGTLTGIGTQALMHNCDSGDTNYRIRTESYALILNSETTVVRTGGANDGTTALSWRMASSATASYPMVLGESPEIVVWNDAVGAAKTVTVEVLTDGVTLKDDECWLEVQYLGTSGFPLGVFASDAKSDVLAAAANQTTSTEAWTTTGLTTPVKQKLSVTFTPQEEGFVHAKVMLAKPSTTVYVCPKASVI